MYQDRTCQAHSRSVPAVWYNEIKMGKRKVSLVSGQYYHIYSRSIAGYVIFNDTKDFNRMVELFDLYRYKDFNYRYSKFYELTPLLRAQILTNVRVTSDTLVDIVAYCVMPTHIHLILKQNEDGGISKFMAKILNSYTRYFNIKHHRLGPLWESKFKDVEVITDEQLLHLTRYFHLNSCSAGLTKKPEDWLYSSYSEYLGDTPDGFCQFRPLFDFDAKQYREFVNDRQSYQRELSIIKKFLIDSQ